MDTPEVSPGRNPFRDIGSSGPGVTRSVSGHGKVSNTRLLMPACWTLYPIWSVSVKPKPLGPWCFGCDSRVCWDVGFECGFRMWEVSSRTWFCSLRAQVANHLQQRTGTSNHSRPRKIYRTRIKLQSLGLRGLLLGSRWFTFIACVGRLTPCVASTTARRSVGQ